MLSVVLAALVAAVVAQPDGPNHPLNANPTDTSVQFFPYNRLPYQVDTSQPRIADDPNWRGPQAGYNQCNSTTEGPNSLCQTLIVNSIDDFCLWGGQAPNSVVGDVEGEMVVWCTKSGRGGRVSVAMRPYRRTLFADLGASLRSIPPGALKAVQFIRTPSYVSVTGHIDQTLINIKGDDEGGELDSGGQDTRGNPIGAVAYSTSMGSAHGVPTQSRTWHAFMGSNIFCQKLCDPKAPNAAGLCLGCEVNVPNEYKENVFESCLGDDQKPVQSGVSDAVPVCAALRHCLWRKPSSTWSLSASDHHHSPPRPPPLATLPPRRLVRAPAPRALARVVQFLPPAAPPHV
ncbi:hypothetical protein EXIGLDRAFT_162763 [Exidia glandulosa HHB12029]|uniref:Uncharacterized protein n=1 Tax=Exidia glandulosa HHB12029 TaxID=1314781 RepID=A0A165FEY7_EXIGL|nr:hypothetical protein EXIGLDRAFT_162763 [Exidia glandulosa HHB12029]